MLISGMSPKTIPLRYTWLTRYGGGVVPSVIWNHWRGYGDLGDLKGGSDQGSYPFESSFEFLSLIFVPTARSTLYVIHDSH